MPKAWPSKSLFIALLIVTLITASFAFAQENKKSEDEVLKLSLNDAVKIAEENNQQIKLSKLGLEKAELGRKQYRYQDKKTKDLEDEGLKPVDPGISSSFEYTYTMDILEKQTEVVKI